MCEKRIEDSMQMKKMSKKRLAVSVVSSALLLQAACFSTAFAATSIIDGNGTSIGKTEGTGAYDIRPGSYNGTTGFRNFKDFNLDKGDIANFIFQVLRERNNGGTAEHYYDDISKFVTLVDGKVNINGIINALDQVGGNLKSGGHLIFVTPGGMVCLLYTSPSPRDCD